MQLAIQLHSLTGLECRMLLKVKTNPPLFARVTQLQCPTILHRTKPSPGFAARY